MLIMCKQFIHFVLCAKYQKWNKICARVDHNGIVGKIKTRLYVTENQYQKSFNEKLTT